MVFSPSLIGFWSDQGVRHAVVAGVIAGLLYLGFSILVLQRDGIFLGTIFGIAEGLWVGCSYLWAMPMGSIIAIFILFALIFIGLTGLILIFTSVT